MDYKALRAEQAALRKKGIHRGIGLACFVEITNPGPAFYGVGGAPISAQDGATFAPRSRRHGDLAPSASPSEGQGTEAMAGAGGARRRSVSRSENNPHRPPATPSAPLWRRHLGLARRWHRRRGGIAGPRSALQSQLS